MSKLRQWSTGRVATVVGLAFTFAALAAPKKW